MEQEEEVVLLNEAGSPIGVGLKSKVHGPDTPLHLAFSCHVVNSRGDVLVTRRALQKRTWPGVWTNSFCGHPAPAESASNAVHRRADQELGLSLHDVDLVLPGFRYRAMDASGIVENEICPVFVARTREEGRPNPAEVMEQVWAEPRALSRSIRSAPWAFSPWLVRQAASLPLLSRGVDEEKLRGGEARR